MTLIDTHAHLAGPRFTGEIPALLERARAAEVRAIISIGTEPEDSLVNVELARDHPAVFAAVGVHPTSIHETGPDWEERLRDLASRPGVVAIGETGLDYFHPPRDGSSESSWRSRQELFFRRQLDLALATGLPAVIHQRNSGEAVLPILREYSGRVEAVLHCFSGSLEEAVPYLDLGFHLSFTGIATFPSAREVLACAAAIPLDRCMVETDSPYLAPVPHRGQRNEPAYVRHVAAAIAEARGMTLEAFAEATTATARRFFRLPEIS